MASQGATLQTYNNELVKCLEELREKREGLNKSVRHTISFGIIYVFSCMQADGEDNFLYHYQN